MARQNSEIIIALLFNHLLNWRQRLLPQTKQILRFMLIVLTATTQTLDHYNILFAQFYLRFQQRDHPHLFLAIFIWERVGFFLLEVIKERQPLSSAQKITF